MGYGVYEEWTDIGYRWAGYEVPAECDFPGCAAQIDRGLGYKCETYFSENEETGEEESTEGCGLFFCEDHEAYDETKHYVVQPKPDSREWINHVLSDPSWRQWRRENPKRVKSYWADTYLVDVPKILARRIWLSKEPADG